MLFDLRGRRKRVIQVAYAILAVLMAASLFTVVGPVNIGDLFGTGGDASGADPFIEQAERLEKQLRRDPQDEQLLAGLVRARYNAGAAQIETDPNTGQVVSVPDGTLDEYRRAADAWNRYLRLDPAKPNVLAAQYAARALQSLAFYGGSTTVAETRADLEAAAEAQRIATEARPSLSSYFQLATVRYYAGDFRGGDEAAQQAEAEVPKSQRPSIAQQLTATRADGQRIQKALEASAKSEGQRGKQALENPLGGLSGGGLSPTSP